MRRKSITQVFRRALQLLLFIGATAALVVQGTYAYKFVVKTGEWFSLSPERGDWGTYGDYVGGLLNPIFSFLAFIGIVFTIILQARQLDEAREYKRHEELQALMGSVASTIDALLRTSPVLHGLKKLPDQGDTNLTLFQHIMGLGHGALTLPPEDRIAFFGKAYTMLMADIGPLITTLTLELHALAWVLEKYKAEGGDGHLNDFYRMRYLAVIVWLKALGHLEGQEKVETVFQPDKYKGIFQLDGLPQKDL
jgi:hypothetical protein